MQHRKIAQASRYASPFDLTVSDPDRRGPHPVDQHVGRQIAKFRLRSNVSQQHLSKCIGVSFQQLQKYESGKNRVSASMLYEIAKALDIPVSRFFEGLPSNGGALSELVTEPVDDGFLFMASAEGRRLIESLMLMHPKVRRRVSTLIAALAEDVRLSNGASGK